MARLGKFSSQKGASFVELIAAMAIMMGATLAVSTVSSTIGSMVAQRRVSMKMSNFSRTVQDVIRYGGSCQTAFVNTPNGSVVLPVDGTSQVITGPSMAADYDLAGSAPIYLNIPGIRSGLARNQDYGIWRYISL